MLTALGAGWVEELLDVLPNRSGDLSPVCLSKAAGYFALAVEARELLEQGVEGLGVSLEQLLGDLVNEGWRRRFDGRSEEVGEGGEALGEAAGSSAIVARVELLVDAVSKLGDGGIFGDLVEEEVPDEGLQLSLRVVHVLGDLVCIVFAKALDQSP